ncbi:hypothetical protein [Pasteurella testudinis]|uniref:hypothetical protein n=1 Tax=Pasteurella testudinis TaxID=761 RepID=UPI001357095E|nr:hypothetical protein [Pasteurella testudinis]
MKQILPITAIITPITQNVVEYHYRLLNDAGLILIKNLSDDGSEDYTALSLK